LTMTMTAFTGMLIFQLLAETVMVIVTSHSLNAQIQTLNSISHL
jgi:hypothetical protein